LVAASNERNQVPKIVTFNFGDHARTGGSRKLGFYTHLMPFFARGGPHIC